MERNFPDTENLAGTDSRLEEKMRSYRDEYQRPQMSEHQVAQLQRTIREAKNMNRKNSRHTGIIRFTVAAAASVGIFVTLPN